MKVLIFTHKSDIDGMGGVILANLAFEEVTYILTETFNLPKEVSKFYENGKIYNYDKIYVTDLWLEEPMLSKVANDKKLKDKFFVFDHHESALKENNNQYAFTNITIKNGRGLCSGTSLFYEYLLKEGYLEKENKAIAEFCELTRQYDTWEWTTIYHNEIPHELTLLFDILGSNAFIKLMTEKLKTSTSPFKFNKTEKMLIANKKRQVKEKLKNYQRKMIIKEVCNLNAGIIFIDYEYRNDIAEYLRKAKTNIDFVILIAMDYGTISYRSIKDNVNVRLIAESYGGKGHDKSASSPITANQKEKIMHILIDSKE